MADQDPIIGIDLGTTSSVVAIIEGGSPKIIPNLEGNRLTPSVVTYRSDGEITVGELARRQAVIYPTRTVHSIKRFMGRRGGEVKGEEKLVSYQIVGGERGYAKVRIDDREYTPPEISALILKKLKQAAEAYLRREVSRAVITVPAYFDDAQRQATKHAGEIAGFRVERIVNEPTAAALAYGLDKKKAQKVAVVDFGGGTFDVSILDLHEGVFEVLSTNGDTRLGGDDFDKLLVNHVADQFQRQEGIDLRGDPMALQRLLEACEMAKKELSTVTSTEITLPFIAADQSGPKHLQTKIHRLEFEQMIAPLIERCCQPIIKAFDDAKLMPRDLDEVILSGGSTRVPRVLEMVRQMFDREPNREVNPDEAVAAGAAIQADLIGGGSRKVVLLDVIPLSLGIETRGGFMARLIERNTTIPTRHTEIFSTSEDSQSIVILRVYQGERERATHNRLLDEFYLSGIRAARQGEPQIEVTFDVDANSILHVSAKDIDTGQQQTVRISVSSGLDDEEVKRLRKDAEDHAEDDKQLLVLDELRHHAESMCRALDETLEHQATGVPAPLQETVRRRVAHIRELAAGGDAAALRVGLAELGRAGQELSTALAAAKRAAKDAAAQEAPPAYPAGTPSPAEDGTSGVESRGEGS